MRDGFMGQMTCSMNSEVVMITQNGGGVNSTVRPLAGACRRKKIKKSCGHRCLQRNEVCLLAFVDDLSATSNRLCKERLSHSQALADFFIFKAAHFVLMARRLRICWAEVVTLGTT